MENTVIRKPIGFRKNSTAQRELHYKLFEVTYDSEWHKKYDPLAQHWELTGKMCAVLAQDVLYEFESMRSYDDYGSNKTYRKAIDSVIKKIRDAFPNLEGWQEYLQKLQ